MVAGTTKRPLLPSGAAAGSRRAKSEPAAGGRLHEASWQLLVGAAAVLVAIAAVWVTLEAEFLRYPGWLAVQKADLILGPVFIGLYWVRRRRQSRFGPMLILLGFVGALY